VYCNPRGSGGYTEAFLRANINNWGAGPTSDVLTALDKTIAEGWADTSKLLITGGSYAGYLTSWIIGHDNRFKAACSQRGVYDLRAFFGEGNAWRLVPNYFLVSVGKQHMIYLKRITDQLCSECEYP
jgi:dipeptidyl aminopeptidase/acylaminoacyl peptidase